MDTGKEKKPFGGHMLEIGDCEATSISEESAGKLCVLINMCSREEGWSPKEEIRKLRK